MRAAFYQTVICLCLLATACKKDKPHTPEPVLPDHTAGVLVACEGSLSNGNAALSLYQENNEVIADVYKTANGAGIGDVLQSLTFIDDRIFLCVNNSDKVLVIGREDFKLQAVIAVPKPRYLQPVAGHKAYVTSLFTNRLFVLNTQTYAVTDTLFLPSENPEEMFLSGEELFVAAWDTACQQLYVINTTTDAVTRTIPIAGRAPQSLISDAAGKLWVLAGNNASGVPATFSRIDPASGALLSTYPFPASADPIRPAFNPTCDTIYWISVNQYGGTNDNGIYRMPITAASLPATPFIPAVAWQYFWALGIDPATGLIYVGDPKGFTQKGSVSVYRQDGTLHAGFEVGVGPGHFYFQ